MSMKKEKEKAKQAKPSMAIEGKDPGSASPTQVSPEEIPRRLKEDVLRWKREIEKNKEYFLEKGVNPYREAFKEIHEIFLLFLNKFDTVAGMKAK